MKDFKTQNNSKVRHDTVARIAAPVYASYPSHAIAAPIVEAPVSQLVETRHLAAPAVAAYASEAVVPSWGSTVISAPEVYATGPGHLVAVIKIIFN